MRGNAFAPAHVAVPVGTTVTWTNDDDAQHDVVFDGGTQRSELLADGESYQRTFASAGTFDYACSVHPQMRGRVTVRG
jgi:plastocyanin